MKATKIAKIKNFQIDFPLKECRNTRSNGKEEYVSNFNFTKIFKNNGNFDRGEFTHVALFKSQFIGQLLEKNKNSK